MLIEDGDEDSHLTIMVRAVVYFALRGGGVEPASSLLVFFWLRIMGHDILLLGLDEQCPRDMTPDSKKMHIEVSIC